MIFPWSLNAKFGSGVPHRYKPYRCLHLRASNRVLGSKVTNKHLANTGSHTEVWCVHMCGVQVAFPNSEKKLASISGNVSYIIKRVALHRSVIVSMFSMCFAWRGTGKADCPIDILLSPSQS